MKLEDQVCNLDLAKRLKELGVKQESYFWWCEDLGEITLSADCRIYTKAKCGNHPSAFTVAELGEILPNRIMIDRYSDGIWSVKWIEEKMTEFSKTHREQADNEVHARAKMLIYLIEQGLVKICSV